VYAGIDFGTSNSSLATFDGDEIHVAILGDTNPQIPSALYSEKSAVEIAPLDNDELENRVLKALRTQKSKMKKEKKDGLTDISRKLVNLRRDLIRRVELGEISDGRHHIDSIIDKEKSRLNDILTFRIQQHTVAEADLRSIERGLMRREQATQASSAFESEALTDVLNSENNTYFGKEAILRHISDPLAGYFVKSPKTFLGSDLSQERLQVFTEVIAKILAHIKTKSEAQFKENIDEIVLGRPVNFHGPNGNNQALSILRTAAASAGFKQVEFQFEPVAAALDFEATLSVDTTALIVDVGGGTTDCTMMRLGPSFRNKLDRTESILSYAGKRIGGIDLDIRLAMSSVMPHLGKDACGLSNSIFWAAASVNNVSDQVRFYSRKTKVEIQDNLPNSKLNRLLTVHDSRLTNRLNHSSELAKILLSDKDSIKLPLKYIEKNLIIPISIDSYRESIQGTISEFLNVIEQTINDAGVQPEVIYVTGGTAKSPIFQQFIRNRFSDTKLVIGDYFESVTSGLARWANIYFA
jgi:hypothetical chaperone protein